MKLPNEQFFYDFMKTRGKIETRICEICHMHDREFNSMLDWYFDATSNIDTITAYYWSRDRYDNEDLQCYKFPVKWLSMDDEEILKYIRQEKEKGFPHPNYTDPSEKDKKYENMQEYLQNNNILEGSDSDRIDFIIDYVNYLKDPETNPASIAQSLSSLACCINVALEKNDPNTESLLSCCEKIARGLRIYAVEKSALSFYIGVYNEETDYFRRVMEERKALQKKIAALEHPNTRDVLDLLSKQPDCTQKEIADRLSIDESAVSEALRLLLDTEWIEVRCGEEAQYSMTGKSWRFWRKIQ